MNSKSHLFLNPYTFQDLQQEKYPVFFSDLKKQELQFHLISSIDLHPTGTRIISVQALLDLFKHNWLLILRTSKSYFYQTT